MYIDPTWRILTIGDGDLSFSWSLHKYHAPKALMATVYDEVEVLKNKYQDNCFDLLADAGCPVKDQIDITEPESFRRQIPQTFDVVIFQFPLIPNHITLERYHKRAERYGVNALNRHLLRRFLINAFDYFLDPEGEQLCFITSKDVKPYCDWNIENLVSDKPNIHFQGMMAFDKQQFPEYRIRNVDRDKEVKQTQGRTYVWSRDKESGLNHFLVGSDKHRKGHCSLCGVGPILTERDRVAHKSSKRHQKLRQFEDDWQRFLQEQE